MRIHLYAHTYKNTLWSRKTHNNNNNNMYSNKPKQTHTQTK